MNFRAAFVFASLILISCGPQQREPNDDYVDHDMGVITSGLNAGQAGGCDVGIVKGLSNQIIEEVNCIAPSTMVNFSGALISAGASVNTVLAPGATTALRAAVAARGVTMGVSSAYRTVAEQYVLYKWWKAGQCGIQIAAAPGASNHQSGRALDVPSYSAWITALQARGWTWYGSNDVVHFDFNGAVNLGSRSVLAFQRLWNKNNGSKLVEDGAWGPASSNAMSVSPTTGFGAHGCAAPPPPPPPPPPVAMMGTLNGKIFKINPVDPADLTAAIAGATVKVGTQTLTTDATGIYTVQLAAGAVTIEATATGYSSATLTRQITSGQTVWGSIGLGADGTPDTHAPDVELLTPEEGKVFEVSAIAATGTASDDRGVMQSLTLSLNGGTALAFASGAFTIPLTLRSGLNVLRVEAVDLAGNRTVVQRNVSFRTGVGGVVTDSVEAAPLGGVEIRVLDVAGSVLMSTHTLSDGSYDLELPAGQRTLVAWLPGYAEYRQPVEISEETHTAWSFALSPGIAGTGVRITFPRPEEALLSKTVWVSGVTDGFLPKDVRINGVPAQVVSGNLFTAEIPLIIGHTLIEAVATLPDGSALASRVNVVRLDVQEHDERMQARGGCSAAGGPWLLSAVLLLVGMIRRRRT